MAGVLKSHRPVTFNDIQGLHCTDANCETVVPCMMDFYRHQAEVIERECIAQDNSNKRSARKWKEQVGAGVRRGRTRRT